MSDTYMLRLRVIAKDCITPAGGQGEHDIFVMHDIGRTKPQTIVKQYHRNGFHVVHMMPIPDWEGVPQ